METRQGILEIVANQSFLKQSGGGTEIQLVMRNTPPGGDFAHRSAAATAYLTEVVGAVSGDGVAVTGDIQGEGLFLVDSAKRA